MSKIVFMKSNVPGHVRGNGKGAIKYVSPYSRATPPAGARSKNLAAIRSILPSDHPDPQVRKVRASLDDNTFCDHLPDQGLAALDTPDLHPNVQTVLANMAAKHMDDGKHQADHLSSLANRMARYHPAG